ncbi:hypothetical protein [Haloquadratum walsbyi]|uniref:Probable secreted glycoprotein n=1 Tax=Haloquadratum walsbyi (strain DSM 16854 / JCM 12705 / C23) TaxID=768065 RepID=G0LNE5_HALWC|nr:hypothetical protein [Haloquadratum walsbyi]CCC41951.1 probable secreted glycoprotein [Haloquadratum walsbyi C23]
MPSRRNLLKIGASTCTATIIAGCFGGDSDSEDTSTNVPEETPSEEETPTETDTPEDVSLFADYGINETGFTVELTQSALGEVAQIQLETPSEERIIEIQETITEYTFEIVSDRAGVWSLTALTSNDDAVETVEVEITFEASVEEIGTLAQLGITGESPEYEQVHMQMTIINDGDVPLEPDQDKIELVVPGLNIDVPTFDADTSFSAEDEDDIITSGNDGIYTTATDSLIRAPFTLETYNLPDGVDRDDPVGESFQGQIKIVYEAEREDTTVPIDVIMGDNVMEFNSTSVYYEGTEVKKR